MSVTTEREWLEGGKEADWLEGIDSDDMEPIHLRKPDAEVTWCGLTIPGNRWGWVPPGEWDDPDVCPACLAAEASA